MMTSIHELLQKEAQAVLNIPITDAYEKAVVFVTSSTPVCSIVASIRLGSDVPVWATSACACRFVYIVSRTWISARCPGYDGVRSNRR